MSSRRNMRPRTCTWCMYARFSDARLVNKPHDFISTHNFFCLFLTLDFRLFLKIPQKRKTKTIFSKIYLKSIFTNSAKHFDPNQARRVVRYDLGPNWQRPSTDDKCHGTNIGWKVNPILIIFWWRTVLVMTLLCLLSNSVESLGQMMSPAR